MDIILSSICMTTEKKQGPHGHNKRLIKIEDAFRRIIGIIKVCYSYGNQL